MRKAYYRSVFISDTHLCSKDCQAEMLLRFLDSFDCEYLYLLGDIVDMWHIGKKTHWPRVYNRIIQTILRKAEHGTQIVYIPGNHDELARHMAGHRFGNIVVGEMAHHFAADGKKLLAVHGDQFDTIVMYHVWLSHLGGTAYDWLIKVNRVLNRLRRKLGLPYMSLAAAVKRRVKGALQYLTDYENTLADVARTRGVDGVVCGHIHQPVVKTIGEIQYLNSGDWVENCSAVVEDERGRFSVVRAHELFDHSEELPNFLSPDAEPAQPLTFFDPATAVRVDIGMTAAS